MREAKLMNRMESMREITVSDLFDWCVHKGLDPKDAHITMVTVKWQSPETEKERESRERWNAEHLGRTNQWERETYERLKEKFEGRGFAPARQRPDTEERA